MGDLCGAAAFEVAFLVPALGGGDAVARTHQPHLAPVSPPVVIVPSVRYLSWPDPANARHV